MQNKKCSRLIALLLAVVLVIGVVPGQVFADTGSAVSSENTGSAPGDQSLVDEDDTQSGTVTGQDPASLNGGQQTGEKQTDGKQGDETDQLTPPTNTDDNKGPDGDTEVPEPTKVTDPTKDTDSTQDTDPTKDTDSTQDTDPTKDTDPTQDTDPTKDTDPTQVTEPTQDTEPTDPTDPPEEEEDKIKLVVFQDGNGNELWQIEVPKGSVLWTDDDQTPWTDMEEKDWTAEQEEGEEKEPEQWSAPADFTLDQQEHKEISVTRYLVSKAEGDKPARYYYTFTIGDVFYFTYGGELPTLDGSTFIAWKDESGSFVIDDDVTFLPEFEQEQVQTISVVSWNWVDEQEMLGEIDGVWGIGLPGVNQENPLTQEALAELLTMLPQQITATTETGEEVTLKVEWDLSVIPENADSGEYVLQAKIVDPSYVLAVDAPALTLTLQLGQTQTFTELPSGTPPHEDRIIPGVSPNGTTIDLFDYWITGQLNADDSNGPDFLNQGINANHALLFGADMKNNYGSWNEWTGNEGGVRAKIVSEDLGKDGYPTLNNLDTNEVWSLRGRNGSESLAYLFDTSSFDGKARYPDVQGLLQVDKDGYYYYDSTENYAVYYDNLKSFVLYDLPGVRTGGQGDAGQFFPFNEAAESISDNNMNNVVSTDRSLNHYFGIHMSTRFVQQNGGYTDSTQETAVTYEFTGDDDVWIFIDGKLVGDLGGIHSAASISINFATGVIKVNGETQEQTLGEILKTRSDTLPNDSYHTLDFFYLERGNVDSNMKLKYNLVTIPESSVIKVDQLGNRIPDVTFGLYAADNLTNAIATGTTDGSGEFVFLREEGGSQYPITIQELHNKYSGAVDSEGNNLILKEIGTPVGYRPVGDIGLKFAVSDNGEVLLLSNDTWTEGAYAMSKVTATTANTIKLETSNTAGAHDDVTLVGQDAVENPLMFAVVLQKQSDGNTWLPISGDPIGGWYVQPDSSWGSVLAAAKDNPYIFQLASSGAYQVEVSNLPGDITTYYYVCGDEDTAKYTIAYYYTKAATLAEATAQNTWRIDSDTNDQGYKVSRVFSMDVYVSNIKNYLLVQKVNDEGKPVNDAAFALYEEDSVIVSGDTVTIPESATPYDTLTTQYITNPLELEGGGLFPSTKSVLPEGEYYLVETAAPTGYKKLVSKPIHVVVDDTGVYADAGVANDNVTVLRGVGSVVRSMVQFAAGDNVDTTLHNIKAALATDVSYNAAGGGGFSWNDPNWDSQDVLHLEYDNEGGRLDYGPHDQGGKLALATDVGWSKLLIQQCDKQHNAALGGNWTDLSGRDITKLFSGTVTVRVVNDRTGNLKISKTVGGENPPDDAEFTFTVNVTDDATPLNGTFNTKSGTGNGTITFTEGKAEVTLKHSESLTILGLPYNADYTVTEKAVSGYSTDIQVSGDGLEGNNGKKTGQVTVTGKIPHCTTEGQAVTLDYTNTYDGTAKVSLEGTKTFLGRTNSTETFTFTLTAGNNTTQEAITNNKVELPTNHEVSIAGEGDFTFDVITFKEAGTYTFNIKEKTPEADSDIAYDRHTAVATVVIKKTGDVLEVESVTYTNAGAPFADDVAKEDKAAFTNAAASLTISKTVTGAMGDRDKPFDFQITVTQDGTPVTGSFPISNGKPITLDGQGKGTFQLKHGESIKIYGLPVGASYTISEPDAGKDGYTTKVATNKGNAVDAPDHSASGTVTDALQTVAFTNNRETGVNTGIWLDTTPMILAVLVVFAAGAVLLLTRGRGRRGGKYAR